MMARSDPEQANDASSEVKIRQILEAASTHNIEDLTRLIEIDAFSECRAVDVQESATGTTPLHAAIASCGANSNGAILDITPSVADPAEETVRFLLENGAIWNQLNQDDLTPGCLALRLGQDNLYQIMVDAGVRAEMLLNRLDDYEQLPDDDDEDTLLDSTHEQLQDGIPAIVVSELSTDPEAIQAALNPDNSASMTNILEPNSSNHEDVNSVAYLSSALALSHSKILDEQRNGVMMEWEKDIMRHSADALLYAPGLRVLNIGFGMGIIDSIIQSHSNRPAEHHIIEAHPDILKDMEAKGWLEKSGVFVHAGTWQDLLPNMLDEGLTFDAIYYDTFAESYKDFKDFFSEHVLGLLESTGRWSYFNGMGADRQISYDVYQKVVEMDLLEAGYDIEWQEIELPQLDQQWEGVRRKYWDINKYRLPACKFLD